MITTHELVVRAICPVDGTEDVYDVRIDAGSKLIPVELILEQAQIATEVPVYQEGLTAALAGALGARVTTVGTHSDVKVTCTAGG